MGSDGTGVRHVVAVILALTASVAFVVGAVSVSARRTLYAPARVPELSRELLDDPEIRSAIADKLTTRLTTVAPALRDDRDAVQEAAELLTTTEAFRVTFAGAVATFQRDLRGGAAPEVVLRLDGMLAALQGGLEEAFGLQFDVPPEELTGVIVVPRGAVESYRRVDDVSRITGWLSIVIGGLSAAGAVAMADRRRQALIWVGVTVAVAALLALLALAVAKGAALSQVDTSSGQDAVSAVWDVAALDVREALVLVVLAGIVGAVIGLALQVFRGDRPVSDGEFDGEPV